jgi:hypothetical protein
MWQPLIIALLVSVAAGYVIWTFMSMRARQRLLDVLAAHGMLVRAAARHRARLATPGCGNCPATADHSAGPARVGTTSMQARNPRKAIKADIKA